MPCPSCKYKNVYFKISTIKYILDLTTEWILNEQQQVSFNLLPSNTTTPNTTSFPGSLFSASVVVEKNP